MAVEVYAGQLKKQIVLKLPTPARNNQGGKEFSYSTTLTAKAKVAKTNRRLVEIAPALLNTDTVWIRYSEARKVITKDWLVSYDSIDHQITEIEFLGAEENDFIKLIVKGKHG